MAKNYFFVAIFCFFHITAFAEEGFNVPNCMTEKGAFEYQDKEAESIQKRESFLNGIGFTRDLEKCRSLGSPYASYVLGEDNMTLAFISLNASKSLANTDYELAKFAQSEVARYTQKALELFNESAERGYSFAYYEIGIIYYEGKYVPKNNISAGKYFVKAGFGAYLDKRINLLNKSYELAKETVPDHPDLPRLKSLVYQ